MAQIAGIHAAPEPDLDARLVTGARTLELQRLDGQRRRVRIERHIQHGGHPSGGCRSRGAVEALPVGASRFVDVDMRVDNAGNEYFVRGKPHVFACRNGVYARTRHPGDDPVVHADPAAHLHACDQSGAVDDQIMHGGSVLRLCRVPAHASTSSRSCDGMAILPSCIACATLSTACSNASAP